MTDMPNTRIHFLYRDGANYKVGGSVVVAGSADAAQQARLRRTLDEGEYFVPTAVGIEPVGFATKNDDDHPFHELLDLEPTGDEPTDPRTLEELIAAFEAADWTSAAAEAA